MHDYCLKIKHRLPWAKITSNHLHFCLASKATQPTWPISMSSPQLYSRYADKRLWHNLRSLSKQTSATIELICLASVISNSSSGHFRIIQDLTSRARSWKHSNINETGCKTTGINRSCPTTCHKLTCAKGKKCVVVSAVMNPYRSCESSRLCRLIDSGWMSW